MQKSLDLKTSDLPDNLVEAQKLCMHLAKQVQSDREFHQNQIKHLRSQFVLFVKSARPELLSQDAMECLFDEVEMTSEPETEPELESEKEETDKKKKKKNRKKKQSAIPEHLPRTIVEHDLPEDEKVSASDGSPLKQMGYDKKEELKYTPAKFEVIEHRYLNYSTSSGEVKRVETPAILIPGSFATSELLANIAVSKYCDHLPLNRQSEIFSRLGVNISRQVLASWMIKLGEALNPLIGIMHEQILESEAVSADESPVKLLTKNGIRTSTQSYMWQLARWGPNPLIIFEYDQTRKKEVAERLLGDYSGYIQIDGYAGYNILFGDKSPRKRVGCLAHVLRKFKDFIKTLPGSLKKTHSAKKIQIMIDELYDIERPIRHLPAESRFRIRKASDAAKILEGLQDFIALEVQSVAASPYLEALKYASNELPYIARYLENGHVEIDNNFTENSFRKLALGRRNWLFICAEKGAQASANIYSVLLTAKANGLDPYNFLLKIINRLPHCEKLEDYEALLPSGSKSSDSKN